MLQKSSIFTTLEIFFKKPTKAQYLMEISKEINLAHTSVKTNLDILCKSGMITEIMEKKGSRKFPLYKANTDNVQYKIYKKMHNLASLLESGLVEYIRDTLSPRSIVVFGSYSRGEDIEDSDIDVYVECEKRELDIKKFEKKLFRKIEINFNKNFSDYPKELKNNIINGVIIFGFLEGFK